MIVLLALACSSKHTDAPVAAAPAPVAVESNVPAGALPGATPLERGTYLTSAVVDCVHCHTKRDLNDFRNAHGPEWAGGEVFDAAWKIPGTVITPNLTSDVETGIGAWTDDEVERAIREGVNRQGERLFPLMPSHYFQAMSDEDLAGIVAVLQSLPPATKPTTQQTVLQMPREALPKLPPITSPVPPSPTDPVARGEYLVRLANCRTCHSPTKGGQEIQERFLAGGVYFTTPFGSFPTPNLTPDPVTGLGCVDGRGDQDAPHHGRSEERPTGHRQLHALVALQEPRAGGPRCHRRVPAEPPAGGERRPPGGEPLPARGLSRGPCPTSRSASTTTTGARTW